ncbi:MAG TPA: hypothetical protein VGM90_31210 [Kofleriaceae bacterium]
MSEPTSVRLAPLVVTHGPNAARRAKRTMYLQKGQFSEIQV